MNTWRSDASATPAKAICRALCGALAKVPTGVHILRQTFCSHLIMRGAAMRAVQELVGHKDLTMTQRYSHLSPAALVHTIRSLESRVVGSERAEILETAEGRQRKLKS